jgi:hypothetical protein
MTKTKAFYDAAVDSLTSAIGESLATTRPPDLNRGFGSSRYALALL